MQFLGLVVFVVIIAGIAFGISRLRKSDDVEVDTGIGTTKRLFYYVVSFAALMVAANGLVILVRYIVDSLRGGTIVSVSDQMLALGLALSLVGTPLWFFFWTLAQRSVKADQIETRSFVRKLYIYAVLGISLGFLASGLISLLRAILGSIGFEGSQIGTLLIWGALWAYHWHVESAEGQHSDATRNIRRLYVYGASGASVVLLAVGLGVLIRQLLLFGYDNIAGTTLVGTRFWGDTIKGSIAMALVGGAGWWWHWHVAAKRDAFSTLRSIYLYMFAIFGGATTVVITASVFVYALLQWAMGAPNVSPAGEQFRLIPAVLAAILTGGAVWGYHSAVLQQEAETATAETIATTRRVYRYLLASIGLGVLAAALIVLVSMAIALAVTGARDILSAGGWWKNQLSLVLTLLLVGTPVWGYFWYKAQGEASRIVEERNSGTRRVFIYVIFGVAVLAVLGSLSSVLYFVLQQVLNGNMSSDVLRNAKWGIGILLATGAISIYYWLVLQEDRRVLAPLELEQKAAPAGRKMVTVLAPQEASSVVDRLESRLGYSVGRWRGTGDQTPAVSEEQLEAAVASISQAESTRVLVTIGAGGVTVLPYEE